MRKHTVIGGKDRCDYRAMSTSQLIEEAKYTPNIELCIALGERLDEEGYERRWVECPYCAHEFEA